MRFLLIYGDDFVVRRPATFIAFRLRHFLHTNTPFL